MTKRKVLRVQWHDYNNGVYFITICTFQKKHLFGHISKGRIHYTKEGEIVRQCIKAIPFHHRHVELWNYVVMPNHIHFVIAVGAQYFAPTRAIDALRESLQHVMVPATTDNLSNVGCIKPPRHGEACTDNHFNSKVAVIVRSFKAACTIEINRNLRAQNIAPLQIWQRNYHEHIIREQYSFDNIMYYIDHNVAMWDSDCFNRT